MKTKIYLVLAVQIVNLLGFISISPAFATDDCGSPNGSSGPGCDICSRPNPPCECFGPCEEKRKTGTLPPQLPPPPVKPPKEPEKKEEKGKGLIEPTETAPAPVYINSIGPSCKRVTLQTEPVTPNVSELCDNSTSVHHTSTVGFTYNTICIQDAQDPITGIANLANNGTLSQSVACNYPISVISTAFGLLSNPAIPSADTLRLQMLATGQFNTNTTPGLNTTTNTTTSDGSTTTTTTTQNEDGSYTLSGTVIGGDTQVGVSGIEVTLLSEGNAVIGSTTDTSGNFFITGIQGTGNYQVKAVDIRSVDMASKYFFGIVDLPITQKNSTVKLEGIANTSSNKNLIDTVSKLNTTTSENSSLTDWLDGLFNNKNTNGSGVNDTGTNSTTSTGGLSSTNGNGTTSNSLTSNSLISLLNNGFTLENGSYSPASLSVISKLGNTNAICGNGIPETGESCDDGRNNGKNGYCSSDCLYFGEVRSGDSSLGGDSIDGGNNTTSTIVNKFSNLTGSLFNTLGGNKEEIKKEISQVNLEISTLDAEINTKTTERTVIEEDLIQSKADLEEVQNEILQYTSEKDALLQSIKSREIMIESLKETLATLKPNSPEAKKIVSEIAALEKLNESEKAQAKVLESKIALAKVKESQLIDKITQVTKKLNNINNELKQLMDKREKAVSKRDALIKQLNGNIVSNGITSLFSILGAGINRVVVATNEAQTWSKNTIVANTSPETRKVMKQVAVVTKEVAKYSVIGVTILLGAAALSLNIMVFKTQWKAYTIADGDTFDSIGSKFNMTERAIRRRNGIAKNKGLRQGMKIKVRNRAFIEKDYLDQLKSVLSDSLKTRDHGDAVARIQKFFKK